VVLVRQFGKHIASKAPCPIANCETKSRIPLLVGFRYDVNMVTDGGVRARWRSRHSVTRRVLRGLIRFLFALLTRFRIEGSENIPSSGPLIVAANHFHFADPLAVIRAMPWSLDFIGGFRMPFAPVIVRWIPRLWGLYRVRRSGSSRGALRQAEETLKAGGVLGIFPEGGSWADVLKPPRPGTAFLATRTQAHVLPIGLDGVTEIFPSLRRFRRAQVTVRIGKPIGPFSTRTEGRKGREEIDAVGNTILRAIAKLIPPERRGVFSEDPRLRAEASAAARYPWQKGRFLLEEERSHHSGKTRKGGS
jgi:1-acyl-sn-glycerol-3-phosphate acyltransferase